MDDDVHVKSVNMDSLVATCGIRELSALGVLPEWGIASERCAGPVERCTLKTL